ncbi:MAG TPA: ADP-ribosylglycohydrolase family protein, partial [Pseudolysinimonas sp.]
MSAAGGDLRERALAALHGLAIGDALGMPTQLMSRVAIAERFGVIDGFRAAAPDHPIAASMPAGSITDDTEQALLLAHTLIDGGGDIEPADFARRLAAWEDGMRARGSLDLLGPSTRAAVAAVLAGTAPEEAGRTGTTNGAAMRVTPVGIAWPSSDLPALVAAVRSASRVSHDTGIAIAGASAVAAAVSAGLDGAELDDAIDVAIDAARRGAALGTW